ncbi:MAG: ribose-phosphate diphosphokinase [Bacteroidetes bacterium]|nr:ribose-phosphate diphosphokinase [Bacteroidota bacterium]
MINVQSFINKESSHIDLVIASTHAGDYLADKVVDFYKSKIKYPLLVLKGIDRFFSDGEIRVRLENSVNGARVFLIGCFFNMNKDYSINDNLISFLIAVRALKEHGARDVIGVIPYMPYARQDKPTEFTREPTTIKLICDLLIESGIDRIVTLEAHSPQLHGFLGKIPLTNISSIPIFSEVFNRFSNSTNVISVSPDIGSAKLIKHFSKELGTSIVIASKHRPNIEEVEITELVGHITNEHDTAIILDDIISTGGTIEAVCRELSKKGISNIYIGSSHLLGVRDFMQKLEYMHKNYGVKKVYATNSIVHSTEALESDLIEIIDISEIIALVINRLYHNKSVSEVFLHD